MVVKLTSHAPSMLLLYIPVIGKILFTTETRHF
jgi:hypothetical protein